MSDKTFDIRQCTVFKGASVGVRVCVRVCVRAGVRVYFFGFFCLLNLLRKVCFYNYYSPSSWFKILSNYKLIGECVLNYKEKVSAHSFCFGSLGCADRSACNWLGLTVLLAGEILR